VVLYGYGSYGISSSYGACLRPSSFTVNRHTGRYTGFVSVVSQCKNWCLAEGLRKRRSVPPYGP